MKKMLSKKMLIFVLSAVAIMAISVTVAAQTRNRNVTALMNYELTVRLDGEALTLRDANGNIVQPLSYDGTTYLPLRALAEILGLDVGWDAATQTVSLYSRRDRALWLADHAAVLRTNRIGGDRASIVRGVGNMPQREGAQFNSAIAVTFSTNPGSGTIELDSRYTSLSFESVFYESPRDRDFNFTIVNADTDTTLHQMTVTPNTFYDNISFELYGATRIRIEVRTDGSRGNDGNTLFLLNPLLVD